MISVVMPSYLGQYKNAAKNRPNKLIRAINSVLNQTYEDWELLVVADGCLQTRDIVGRFVDSRIKNLWVTKQPTWSGIVRNTGINEATGSYICYLDIDDVFAETHLEEIAAAVKDKAWYWMHDWVYSKEGKEFRHRLCNINKPGQCGTSNLIHKKIALWNKKDNYAHDWNFIKNLKRASKDYECIKGGRYLVAHIPGRYDV